MNTQTTNRPSATIHQFPLGGRSGRVAERMAAVVMNEYQTPAPRPDVMGGSWYHEAAIREADGTLEA